MPIAYLLQADQLLFRSMGEVRQADQLDVIRAGLEDAHRAGRRDGRRRQLIIDLRLATGVIGNMALRRIARLIVDHAEHLARRGALLVGDDLRHGIARVLAARAGDAGLDLRVFRDPKAAGRWLTSGPMLRT
ncbi:MAG: hypothetical protein H6807_09985 [Planctomycetes bacterium]|nr:hypothetical protein [Planctomycetota bacterium]